MIDLFVKNEENDGGFVSDCASTMPVMTRLLCIAFIYFTLGSCVGTVTAFILTSFADVFDATNPFAKVSGSTSYLSVWRRLYASQPVSVYFTKSYFVCTQR